MEKRIPEYTEMFDFVYDCVIFYTVPIIGFYSYSSSVGDKLNSSEVCEVVFLARS